MDSLFSPISAGATIGVVALGSPLSPEREALGVAELKKRGYQVAMPLACSKYYGDYANGFSNGSIEQRLAALRELLEDPSVSAVLSARGGYGLMELLPALDEPWAVNACKPIIGLSDMTALLSQSRNRFSAPMIHGPSLGDAFADAATNEEAKLSVDSLCALLEQRPFHYEAKLKELRTGQASGSLLVGNLSIFCALLGTAWDVSFDGAVLVLEDVGEPPYRIHRNLLQLTLAGKFKNIAGLVFGRFAKCEAMHGPSVEQVWQLALNSFWKEDTFPVAAGISVGHWGENHALPVGYCATLKQGNFVVDA